MIRASFHLALNTLKKNKVRTTLTVFGITIGIAMVILVLSAGGAVKGLVLDQLASFGDNWISVDIKIPSTKSAFSSENSNGLAQGVTITTLTAEDGEAIKKLPNIQNMYAAITSQAIVSYKNEKQRPTVFGVSASYPEIDKTGIAMGRFFTDEENESAQQVAVLGHEMWEKLFGNTDPVDKYITVDKKTYRVVGVMAERGAVGFFNIDAILFLPLKTTQKKILGVDHVLNIIAQTKDNSKSESTAEEIRFVLRDRHDISNPDKDDFAVTTMTESLETVNTVITGITWLLIALASISLLVGGVGIMNVMYVSVAERTFEIGLRKAVGANERHILYQFLIEALVLTLAGGVLGIVVGICISYLISVVAGLLNFHWEFSVPIFSLLLATSFSTATGLIFGLYPAKRAASLNPIEAIRQE